MVPFITGRAIAGNQMISNFLSGMFGLEVLYSCVIIICSLMIYYATKEMYELSSYKGIKYFRQAFLFFAIAYFFRSFIKLVLIYFNAEGILEFSPRIFGVFTLFIFMYFSFMAIFYLLYSVMWKKWNGNSRKIYLFHILAFVVSTIIISLRNPFIYLGLNFFLLIIIVFIVYTAYKSTKNKTKGHNLYAVYLLLFIFWILNILNVLIPRFFQNLQLLIYLASSGIFLMILYKVLKKVGN
jgi:hypothetical protein